MKTEILVSGPLIRISLQLARPRQGRIVLDLHQDLIDWSSQRGETRKPSSGQFGVPILPSFSGSVAFRPLSYRASSCLSLFLAFFSQASSESSTFMYLVA